MHSLLERHKVLRGRKHARTLLLTTHSVTHAYPVALYRRPSNWQLRLPPKHQPRRRQNWLLLLTEQGTPVPPPTPPTPVPGVLGPNSAQVVFASIDFQATVISQYANWS